MRLTVAVIGLLLAFVGDADLTEDRLVGIALMFLLETLSKVLQREQTRSQVDLVIFRKVPT
jgi:hypothetical protein